MLQKRFGQDLDSEIENRQDGGETLTAIETACSITSSPVSAPKHDEKKDEEKMSLFWRVVALVSITLYNSLANSIGDLRAELSREREARTALAKKDDVDARIKTQYERIRTLEGYKADIEAMKERASANAVASETVKKDLGASLDALKKDTAGLELLKERVAVLDALKKDIAGIDGLKEKVATLSADLKVARDDVQKAQQEVEKNKAADLERKMFRDAQAKQLDETIKELQKDVQGCREKIARLEGSQVGPPERPTSKP